jgi:hypothetical protein
MGLRELSKAPKLVYLDGEENSFGEGAAAAPAQLSGLKELELSVCSLDSDNLQLLESLTQLEKLELNQLKIKDECIRFLSQLPTLRKLEVRATAITDASEPVLAGLK